MFISFLFTVCIAYTLLGQRDREAGSTKALHFRSHPSIGTLLHNRAGEMYPFFAFSVERYWQFSALNQGCLVVIGYFPLSV